MVDDKPAPRPKRYRPAVVLGSTAAEEVRRYFLSGASILGLRARPIERGSGGIDPHDHAVANVDRVSDLKRIEAGLRLIPEAHFRTLRDFHRVARHPGEVLTYFGPLASLVTASPRLASAHGNDIGQAVRRALERVLRTPGPVGASSARAAIEEATRAVGGLEDWLVDQLKAGAARCEQVRTEAEAALSEALAAYESARSPSREESQAARQKAAERAHKGRRRIDVEAVPFLPPQEADDD